MNRSFWSAAESDRAPGRRYASRISTISRDGLIDQPMIEGLSNDAGADGTTAFADCKAQTFVHRDRRNQLHGHLHVVARHHHLRAFRQLARTRHVRRAEVELRTVVGEERRVTAPRPSSARTPRPQLRVRRDRTPASPAPAALHVVALRAAQQHADVVARLALVQQLAEHLHARAGRLRACRGCRRSRLLVANLDPPRSIRPVTTVPRPEIENTSSIGIRNGWSIADAPARNVVSTPPHQLVRSTASADLRASPSSAFSAEPTMIGVSSPGNSYSTAARGLPSRPAPAARRRRPCRPCSGKHHHVRHADLARQQDVLARLRHRAVAADTTRIAPSICAAPVIMFFT